jgi:hypothetical protein
MADRVFLPLPLDPEDWRLVRRLTWPDILFDQRGGQAEPAQARSPRPIDLARKYLPIVCPHGFAELTTTAVMDKLCAEHVRRGGPKDFFKYDTTERACGRDKRKQRKA